MPTKLGVPICGGFSEIEHAPMHMQNFFALLDCAVNIMRNHNNGEFSCLIEFMQQIIQFMCYHWVKHGSRFVQKQDLPFRILCIPGGNVNHPLPHREWGPALTLFLLDGIMPAREGIAGSSSVRHWFKQGEDTTKGFISSYVPMPELKSSNFMQRSFGERVAMNAPIQGTAADIIKIAMIRVDQKLRARGLRSRLILQVHDELLIETEKEELEEVRELLKEEKMHAADLRVRLEGDVHSGSNWYEAK